MRAAPAALERWRCGRAVRRRVLAVGGGSWWVRGGQLVPSPAAPEIRSPIHLSSISIRVEARRRRRRRRRRRGGEAAALAASEMSFAWLGLGLGLGLELGVGVGVG